MPVKEFLALYRRLEEEGVWELSLTQRNNKARLLVKHLQLKDDVDDINTHIDDVGDYPSSAFCVIADFETRGFSGGDRILQVIVLNQNMASTFEAIASFDINACKSYFDGTAVHVVGMRFPRAVCSRHRYFDGTTVHVVRMRFPLRHSFDTSFSISQALWLRVLTTTYLEFGSLMKAAAGWQETVPNRVLRAPDFPKWSVRKLVKKAFDKFQQMGADDEHSRQAGHNACPLFCVKVLTMY